MVNAIAFTNEYEATRQFRAWAAEAQVKWLKDARADLERNPHDQLKALVVLETAKAAVLDKTVRPDTRRYDEKIRCQPLHMPNVVGEGFKTLDSAVKKVPITQEENKSLILYLVDTLCLIKNVSDPGKDYASTKNLISGYQLLATLFGQNEPENVTPKKQINSPLVAIVNKISKFLSTKEYVTTFVSLDALFNKEYSGIRTAAQRALCELLTVDGAQIDVVQKLITKNSSAPGAAAVQAIISTVYPEKDTRYRPLPDWLEDSFRELKEKDQRAEVLPSADVAHPQAIAQPMEPIPAAAQHVISEAEPQQQQMVRTSSLMHIRFQAAANEVGATGWNTRTVSAPVFEAEAAADNSITLSGGLHKHIVHNLSEEQYFAALENAAFKPTGIFLNLVPLQEVNRQRHGNQSPQP